MSVCGIGLTLRSTRSLSLRGFRPHWPDRRAITSGACLFEQQTIGRLCPPSLDRLGRLLIVGHKPSVIHRDASGRLTYEKDSVPAERYRDVCTQIKDRFGLEPLGTLFEWEIYFQDYRSSDGRLIVGLEWDNWSGFIAVAQNADSEPLVREIASFLADA